MIYFADRKFNILGMASTTLNGGYRLINDVLTEEIETGNSNYDGTVFVPDDNVVNVESMVSIGNYILFVDDLGENRYYTITDSQLDRKSSELKFYSDSAGLDLLNEVSGPWKPDKQYSIAEYFERFLFDSGFEIGVNELPDLKRQLTGWEGSDTITKRLLSVANSFDKAEISFSFDVDKMLVVRKYVNIWKKRGVDLQQELRLNRDIDNIITTKSITNLATAIDAVGGRPQQTGDVEPPQITLEGYVYDDGRYYVKGRALRDRQANAIWSRYLNPQEAGQNFEGYIVGRFEYDTLSQTELFNRALSHLKTVAEPTINYEVVVAKMPQNAKVGDTINIVDDAGELYLNGRVLKKAYSSVTGEGVFTLGDYKIESSGISQSLQDLANKIANIKNGSTFYPWVRYADDENGNGFSATPTDKKYMAIVYMRDNPVPSDDPADYAGKWILIQGPQGQTGQDGKPVYTWIKYADTVSGGGMSDNPSGKLYIGLAFNKPTATASTNPADYNWSLIKGADGQQGIQGPQGPNGATTYFHIAWADNATGTVGFSLTTSLGKKYMGTYSDQTASNSTDPTKYKWVELSNSIEIGGANLIEKTNPITNFTPFSGSVLTYTQNQTMTDWKATDATKIVSSGGTNTLKAVQSAIVGISANGQSYVFSGYIRNNGSTNISLGFNSLGTTVVLTPNESKFVVAKLTGNGVSNVQITVNTGLSSQNLDITVWHWQLERGTTNTDWKPATTDFTNSISAIEQTVNSIVYPVVSPTEPLNPKEGQQWWRTDNTGNVTGYFVYHAALNPKWQPQTIQQSILNITTLNAVNITGSDITGTTLTGSTIVNTFDSNFNGAQLVGTIKLDNAMIAIDYMVKGTQQGGHVNINPLTVQSNIFNIVNGVEESQSGYELSTGGLLMSRGSGTSYKAGKLEADALILTQWINLPLNSGFTTQGTNTPQYRILPQVDGSVMVRFRGQVRPTSGNISLNQTVIFGALPSNIRPLGNELMQLSSSTPVGGRGVAYPNGDLAFQAAAECSYVGLSSISYYIS